MIPWYLRDHFNLTAKLGVINRLFAAKRHRMTILAINNYLDAREHRLFLDGLEIPAFLIPEDQLRAFDHFLRFSYFNRLSGPAVFVNRHFMKFW